MSRIQMNNTIVHNNVDLGENKLNEENDALERYPIVDPIPYYVDNLLDDNYERGERPRDDFGNPDYIFEWYDEQLADIDCSVRNRQNIIDKMHGIIVYLENCINEKQRVIDELSRALFHENIEEKKIK